MFISHADFATGIKVDLSNSPDDPIRVQFGGVTDVQMSFYFSRTEALDLMSQLEKAIHQTAEVV
jgi:hypothetical protein